MAEGLTSPMANLAKTNESYYDYKSLFIRPQIPQSAKVGGGAVPRGIPNLKEDRLADGPC